MELVAKRRNSLEKVYACAACGEFTNYLPLIHPSFREKTENIITPRTVVSLISTALFQSEPKAYFKQWFGFVFSMVYCIDFKGIL